MDSGRQKILLVITKSNWGGAQRYVYDLATNLPRDRFEVIVACGGSGTLITRLKESGVRVIPLGKLGRDISLGDDLGSFFSLLRILRTEHPDILHLNSSKAGGLGALAGRIARPEAALVAGYRPAGVLENSVTKSIGRKN